MKEWSIKKFMEKDIKDKIEYIVICISEFAKKPKLMLPESFNYLRSWKGKELTFSTRDMK